jgi:magnesium-transporting ATPase (P-type)
MTAINVCRELEICKEVLLIDVFDSNVGFRRIKPDNDVKLSSSTSINKSAEMTFNSRLTRSKTVSGSDISPKNLELTITNDNAINLSVSVNEVPTFSSFIPKSRLKKIKMGQSASCDNIAKTATFVPIKTFPIEEIQKALATDPSSSSIAITGAALDMLLSKSKDDDFIMWIIQNCKIFARMKPTQKSLIIEKLINSGKYVGMCGDGKFQHSFNFYIIIFNFLYI